MNKQNEIQVGKGFWQSLPRFEQGGRPLFALAPMADVTDVAFRQIIVKASRFGQPGGGPDVLWNEFVSTDGLNSPGKNILLRDLQYHKNEQPLVAQIFGPSLENMRAGASLCVKLGYAGIDINMGCPDKNVNKQGAGAALCKTPQLAQDIIRATQTGAGDVPVSVKCRLGWSNNGEAKTWIPQLLETQPAALTIHMRNRKDMSKSAPDWDAMKLAVQQAHDLAAMTGYRPVMLANGAIRTYQDAVDVCAYTGCDGVMIGKAVFGNPWLFDWSTQPKSVKDKLLMMINHMELFTYWLGAVGPDGNYNDFIFGDQRQKALVEVSGKNFAIMKKHIKAYCHGFYGAKQLRMELMQYGKVEEIKKHVDTWLGANPVEAAIVPEEYVV